MATTFATNHIRQIGVGLAKELAHRRTGDHTHRRKLLRHAQMLAFFTAGSVAGALCCRLLAERAVWVTLLPFAVVFAALLHSDLTTERDMLERKPAGH